ncbi:MAG: type II 3-dehydroquinate dehydratase [Gammaproteobacteria bacterium]|nr:type II 3-dehydroquinate dehydratase [Gammaproteobacteria bacterium]
MPSILVLNGPNLNLLGSREPEHYGTTTLADIHQQMLVRAKNLNCSIDFFQTNHEGELVDRIHQASTDKVDFIIINPAAFTHTSVAVRDAISGVHIPFIELHLSNVHAREEFRQHSYFSDLAVGVISGLGSQGYDLALQAAVQHCSK